MAHLWGAKQSWRFESHFTDSSIAHWRSCGTLLKNLLSSAKSRISTFEDVDGPSEMPLIKRRKRKVPTRLDRFFHFFDLRAGSFPLFVFFSLDSKSVKIFGKF